ncbi:MAG: fabG 2 [Solirubrobacterales bacterium]|jgi:3-oxoacyl-[acyl-carrier protein] reductase|nr:fabG 2 [Solirubrobacterales bacterium]
MQALKGRTALVTGAARGIGRAIALRLAQDGASVAVNYATSVEGAEALVSEIRGAGGRAVAVQADVGDVTQVDALFAHVEAHLGPVGVLVNNAGLHRGGRVERLAPADFEAVLRASLVGSFLCTARAVPQMKDHGWGRIVQISSPAALRGFAGDAAYGAAKAGQLGMTRCLAVELAPHGITVNAVLPGYVPTEMTSGLSDKSRTAIETSIPCGRAADPGEIAAAVSYLARSEAGYVTGVTLPVDGGIVL